MAFEELELRVHLWRQRELTGILLCYHIVELTPAGLETGGSQLFANEAGVNDALIDAHISPGLVGDDERAATILGLAVWQLQRLGLEPQKN